MGAPDHRLGPRPERGPSRDREMDARTWRASPKLGLPNEVALIQPMTSLFEQALLMHVQDGLDLHRP